MKYEKTYTVAEAKQKLEQYCAYQERCHKEVTNKLRAMGMIPMAIDAIISHLIEQNYLNEERFSRSFARGKFNIKGWGRNRIVQELRFRGISKYNIALALQEISDDEYLRKLDELSKKRLPLLKDSNKLKNRKKMADYLLYRGWESHLVYEKVNELIK